MTDFVLSFEERGIYFNPEVDTICCYYEDITDLESEDLEHIQSLKVILRRFEYTPPITRNGAGIGRIEVNAGKVELRLLRRELVQIVGKAPRMTLFEEGSGGIQFELKPINGMEEYKCRDDEDADDLQGMIGIPILRSTIRDYGQSLLH